MFTHRNKQTARPDLIVIDETFWQGSLVHQRLALDRLTEAGRWRAQAEEGAAANAGQGDGRRSRRGQGT